MSRMANILLRIALAFSFAYPAYGLWSNESAWIGYIPAVVKNWAETAGVSSDALITGLLVFHVVLALWLLSDWRVGIPTVIAAIFLGSVVYFNLNQIDILFRDLSLAITALALAFSPRNRH